MAKKINAAEIFEDVDSEKGKTITIYNDIEKMMNLLEDSDIDLSEKEVEELIAILDAYIKMRGIESLIEYKLPIQREEIRD